MIADYGIARNRRICSNTRFIPYLNIPARCKMDLSVNGSNMSALLKDMLHATNSNPITYPPPPVEKRNRNSVNTGQSRNK